MGHRLFSAILWASVAFAGSGAIAAPPPPPILAQTPPDPSVSEVLLEIEAARTVAQGAIALGLGVGAIALAAGVYQYKRTKTWERIEFLRKAVKEFESDPDIWNALKILDSEEYRDYQIPLGDKTITFQATNDLLYEALATHENRIVQKNHFDALQKSNELDGDALERYQMTSALRDWFNKMLNGLEHFGYFVESGLFTANEIRPWMIYWIRLIADRTYRRPGSSKVYDYLYSYIHEYGFYGVIKLFEEFGYRILPTPYKDDDFLNLPKEFQGSKDLQTIHFRTALSLAKASQLIYQDRGYAEEIAGRWGISTSTCFDYVEGEQWDTQAFLFKLDEYIVLAFRGSQELKDWQTNFSTRFKKFAINTQFEALDEDTTPPRGQVHRGFQAAWNSVEGKVIKRVRQWNQDRPEQRPLLITGHSLGGALATVAAASLAKRNFSIQGLYTFGQPRVGDLIFKGEIAPLLKGKIFRFVNNNDIVPHIPLPYLPWNPTRIYVHLGPTLYFNARGSLVSYPNPVGRFFDFSIGALRGVFEPGFDLIQDHYMEYYISNLQKALEVEKEKERFQQEEAGNL